MQMMEIEESPKLNEGLLEGNTSGVLKCCNGYNSYEEFVTSNQYRQIQYLREESKIKVEECTEEVRDILLEIYKVAFPEMPEPPMIGQEWKNLGFQSENPMTDLRSCGYLSLQNLLYLGKHYPREFSKMVNSSTEYPFMASAINITLLLLIHLRLASHFTFCPCCGTACREEKKVPIREMTAFASFLEDCEWQTVFNELFSLGVMLMDSNYHSLATTDPSFTILDFRKVFAETKKQLMEILRKQPQSLHDMFDMADMYLEK